MRWIACSLALGLALCSSLGATETTLPLKLNPEWKIFLDVESPASYVALPASLKSPGGATAQARTVRLVNDSINLGALVKDKFSLRSRAMLYNEFDSAAAGTMTVGVAADYWLVVHVNDAPVFDTMKNGNDSGGYTPDDHVFTMPVKAGRNLLAVEVLAGSGGWRFVCGVPKLLGKPNVKFAADSEWKVVDMSALVVKAGSALDQSAAAAVPRPRSWWPWKSKGLPRLTISPTGKLVAADNLDVPVRLRGSQINWPWIFEDAGKNPEWRKIWHEQAVAARNQGTNLLRVSFDAMFQQKDQDISPDSLEKADYFVSQLGEQGIYAFLTIGSYGLFRENPWGSLPPGQRRDYKLRMYLGDPEVRKAWQYGAETLMNHVNPHNGLAWKDDPSIACVELFNEQELSYFRPSSNSPQTQAELAASFRHWLQEKYRTPEALAKAWGDKTIDSFARAIPPESFPWTDSARPWNGPDAVSANDYLLFCVDLSRRSAEWMEKTLRATGYRGLVAQYNLTRWLGGLLARYEKSQVSIANTYYVHPTKFDHPGSKCGQVSSLAGAARYWRSVATTRYADRPFIETEYNHGFWNPYQHEGGLVFGAYSALQGFGGLIIHASAAFDLGNPIPNLYCFDVWGSPVVRANEFLSGCLFLRGDLTPSPHRVQLDIPKDYLETDCRSGQPISSEQDKLALMTGFSVAFPWAERPAGAGNPPPPDLVMPPNGGGGFKCVADGWAVENVESKGGDFSLAAAVSSLKAKGILPEGNLSDPAKGVFQSDTGELLMRTKENLLKVVTPRCEAVSLEAGVSEPVGQLKVGSASAPALVAACAVDDEVLAESGRVVLLFSTEVANSGMELSPDRVTMVKLGGAPTLMRVGKLAATLKNANAKAMKLYALGFDGSRREELPLEVDGDTLKISLDTAKLKNGPTPFFELVAE